MDVYVAISMFQNGLAVQSENKLELVKEGLLTKHSI